MAEENRQVLDVDVLYVGAGSASLAGALHLKKISDRDLVMDLPDAIHVPSNVTGKNTNSIFNKLIRRLSQRAKKAISD